MAQKWTIEATALWRKYDSPGEFNSPTYLGITLMALGLAQYCPSESEIYKTAPELMQSTWNALGEWPRHKEAPSDPQARLTIRLC
jgi:hypothetical protein